MRKIRLPKLPKLPRRATARHKESAPRARRRQADPLRPGEPEKYRGAHTPRAMAARPAVRDSEPRSQTRATSRRTPYGQRLTPLSDRPNTMRPKARDRFADVSSEQRATARIAYEQGRMAAGRRAPRGTTAKARDRFGAPGTRTDPAELGRQAAKAHTFGPKKATGRARRPASAVRDPHANPAKARPVRQSDPQPERGRTHPYFGRPPRGSGIGDQPLSSRGRIDRSA